MKTVEIENSELAKAQAELTDTWRDLRASCDAEAIDRLRGELPVVNKD